MLAAAEKQHVFSLQMFPLCSDRDNGPVWGRAYASSQLSCIESFLCKTLVGNPMRRHLLPHLARFHVLVAHYDSSSRDHTWEDAQLPATLLSQLRVDQRVVVAFAVCTPDPKKPGVLFVDYIESIWKDRGYASILMHHLQILGESTHRPLVLPRVLPTEAKPEDIAARGFWRKFLSVANGDCYDPEAVEKDYADLGMQQMEGLDIFLERYWEEEDIRDPSGAEE
jgi:hypothetical protein